MRRVGMDLRRTRPSYKSIRVRALTPSLSPSDAPYPLIDTFAHNLTRSPSQPLTLQPSHPRILSSSRKHSVV